MTNIYRAQLDEAFEALRANNQISDSQLEKVRQASKKFSQLIAESWLRTEPGQKIREALLSNDSEQIKKVFKNHGVDFDEFFPSTSQAVADWDSFLISWKERLGGNPTLKIPYPPQPQEVTNAQLQEWVKNDNPNITEPPYPYIPYSCF